MTAALAFRDSCHFARGSAERTRPASGASSSPNQLAEGKEGRKVRDRLERLWGKFRQRTKEKERLESSGV